MLSTAGLDKKMTHKNSGLISEFSSQGLQYPQTSNISTTLVGNKIGDNSDVVGASPVGAVPATSSFSSKHLAVID